MLIMCKAELVPDVFNAILSSQSTLQERMYCSCVHYNIL